ATGLWQEHFSYQIGNWCRAHGVEYIGHIIEDMNAHAHLGCSGGHFFRSLDGQDMSGIDIVLHQWRPGFAEYPHSASCAGGGMDTEFFHYVLAKLASSHARMNPRMKGRAMCEVFGAYGWAEDTAVMKAMLDHLLIRGVHYFVPHAFSMKFPDPDCPPQFYADGHNPQFGAFAALMRYGNKMSHLLIGGSRVVNAAILYHAEAEWSGKSCMRVQQPAKALADRQIDFEIVSADHVLELASISPPGKLALADAAFDCLIVPGAGYLPLPLLEKLAAMCDAGLELWFVDSRPDGFTRGEVVSLTELPQRMADRGFTDVTLETPCPLMRVSHIKRSGAHVFMFSNESAAESMLARARLPVSGAYTRLDLQLDRAASGVCPHGLLDIQLEPFQSAVFVFDTELPSGQTLPRVQRRMHLAMKYKVSAASYEQLDAFQAMGEYGESIHMAGTGGPLEPSFSGILRYEAEFDAPEDAFALDLGAVGGCAQIELNGTR
ncbi:MAG TPA: glycosyl transferase family 2, partial [Clostridia bacterium]|nr:glycosyl transferase family 2 [Clostridia bacterium]